MDQSIITDLEKSGLTAEDMGVKPLGPSEAAAIKVPTNTKGFVIPYYQPSGERLPFYRTKLFDFTAQDGKPLKYKQPFGTPNHVYFPKNFKTVLEKHIREQRKDKQRPYIILTEGEKKAAACCKAGIPCVALGGTDSWRNRTIILPADTELASGGTSKGPIRAKLPPGRFDQLEDYTLALGLQSLVDAIVQYKLSIVIIYDTDEPRGIKMDVQRAAATLAYELSYLGVSISNIKQVILPFDEKHPKMALDDYLLLHGAVNLRKLVTTSFEARNAFPKHPNPREFINKKLQQGKLSRKEVQEVALTVTAELDSRGRRLRSTATSTPYFFNEQTHALLPASLMARNGEPMHESLFGNFLYREFGISAADTRLITWLAAQFTGEEPIGEVTPKRIIALPTEDADEVAIQISDSHFALITSNPKKPIQIMTNGSYGILFEQGHVEATDPDELMAEFTEQSEAEFEPWWLNIFKNSVNLKGEEHVAVMAAMLYYISPFLLRWRGTQLPVELIIGEAGSGKSSLNEMRLTILTGNPRLRNLPSDLRDWYASVVNTGGLHVIDNIQFTNNDLRQRLSDEMCRLITEPKPHIEMRKLFTTSSQAQVPVNTVFAMTAIQQPFYNADLIQRSAIIELGAVGSGHDSNWVETQIGKFGGRTAWLAHHMLFLHKFLHKVSTGNWKDNYLAEHRLANYEQCLQTAADVFGIDATWMSHELVARTRDKIRESDWTLEAIREYVEYMAKGHPKGFKFTSLEITQWAESHEEHHSNKQLQSSRSLGRYMSSHVTTICKVVGAEDDGNHKGRKLFKVGPREKR